MANWRNLAVTLTLADGKIDDAEVKILRKELFADKKIDKEEVEFLVELRNKAQKKAGPKGVNPAFEKLFFTALETYILEDGVIDAAEVAFLEGVIFADKKVDDNEKKFLVKLNKTARQTCPQFEALLQKCTAKSGPACSRSRCR
jgi:uncharacterized tellurite resistance protein B-like protein